MQLTDQDTALCHEITSCLDRLTSDLTSQLKEIAGTCFSPDVRLLLFEFDSVSFLSHLPGTFNTFDRHGRQIGNESIVMPDGGMTMPVYVMLCDRQSAVGKRDALIATHLFVNWFADCWRDAGGENCPHVAALAPCKDARYFDLYKRSFVTPVELGVAKIDRPVSTWWPHRNE